MGIRCVVFLGWGEVIMVSFLKRGVEGGLVQSGFYFWWGKGEGRGLWFLFLKCWGGGGVSCSQVSIFCGVGGEGAAVGNGGEYDRLHAVLKKLRKFGKTGACFWALTVWEEWHLGPNA